MSTKPKTNYPGLRSFVIAHIKQTIADANHRPGSKGRMSAEVLEKTLTLTQAFEALEYMTKEDTAEMCSVLIEAFIPDLTVNELIGHEKAPDEDIPQDDQRGLARLWRTRAQSIMRVFVEMAHDEGLSAHNAYKMFQIDDSNLAEMVDAIYHLNHPNPPDGQGQLPDGHDDPEPFDGQS